VVFLMAALSAEVTWSPRLLLQTDGVWLHHGDTDAARVPEDAATQEIGLTLRRARVGVDVDVGQARGHVQGQGQGQGEVQADDDGQGRGDGLWRGRLVVSVERPDGTVPTLAADPVAGVPACGQPGWCLRATEAYLGLAPHKAFGVWVGSMRVPIGLSRAVDESELRLPERARIILRATPDFRVGAKLAGDLGLLQYALGVYAVGSGSTRSLLDTPFSRAGPLSVLRLSTEPVGPVGPTPWLRRVRASVSENPKDPKDPKDPNNPWDPSDPWDRWWRFSLGVSAFHARLPGPNQVGVGGDAQLQWAWFCATGELLWTHRGTMDRLGFVIEPGVLVWRDRLELVARGEFFNDDVGPRSPADIWGAAVGVTAWSATRLTRAELTYTLRGPLAGDGPLTGIALVRLQLALPD
jgi:hypothetical protein